MTPSEPREAAVSATDLVEAAEDAIPDDAIIAVAGDLPQMGVTSKIFVPFEPGSLDSAALAAVVGGQKGKVVDSTTQTIRPKGRTTTVFHAAPAKGWDPGVYRITLYNNGDSLDAKNFAVKK